MTTTKHCTKCDETKTVDSFHKDKSRKDGLRTQCKSCMKTYQTANKEVIALYMKTYRESKLEELTAFKKVYHKRMYGGLTHSEKAAKSSVDAACRRSGFPSDTLFGGVSFTEAVTMTLPFAEERLRLEEETGVAYNIDHIIPVAAGGLHVASNLQVITAEANKAKIVEDKVLVDTYNEQKEMTCTLGKSVD